MYITVETETKHTKRINRMKATYQGTAKEELQARILNVESTLLNNEMEAWEAKEYNEVIKEYKSQINQINQSQELLDIMEMEIALRKINFFVGGLTDEAIKFHYNRIFN